MEDSDAAEIEDEMHSNGKGAIHTPIQRSTQTFRRQTRQRQILQCLSVVLISVTITGCNSL